MWSTATELWREWVRLRVIRPQDYDTDVAEHLSARLAALGGPYPNGPITDAMDRAGWSARDLIHALAPLLSSFAGMQRDLLRLLERVGATSGTGENIRVSYEFADGDTIDESLAAFREHVRLIETVVIQLKPWTFTARHAWGVPVIWDHVSSDWIDDLVTAGGADRREAWRFENGIPDVEPSGDARVDGRASRVVDLVRYVLGRLESIGADTVEVRDRVFGDADEDLDAEQREIGQAAADFWPLSVASGVHGWVAAIARGATTSSDEQLEELDRWLDGFEAGEARDMTVERAVDLLTDVLSLPAWGKRHELYSAWIATQVDRALDSRLEFVVTDGALRFPFRATLLARLDPPDGDLTLWCEVRLPAAGPLGGGRKANIQPDYCFRRGSDDVTVAAVEVKQYKAAASGRHAVTMRDYVGSLPGAPVFLVAHGPLGDGALDAVPVAERGRGHLHPNVRPDRPRESGLFRADVAASFPPPRRRPARIELRWSPRVHDVDLHVRLGDSETSYKGNASHSVLRKDEVEGGPEIVDLVPGVDGMVEVRVHVYSSSSLEEARPVVAFFGEDGLVAELVPTQAVLDSGERWWTVAHIEGGRVVADAESRMQSWDGVGR